MTPPSMDDKIVTSAQEADTIALAIKIAGQAKQNDIICLKGPMGAGKSVFARAFIQHLMGNNIDVPSPTFTLIQTYEAPKHFISHFDLYRLEDPEEIYEIGFEDALSEGISLIEWPERLGHLIPTPRTDIIFEPVSAESRKITISHHSTDKI